MNGFGRRDSNKTLIGVPLADAYFYFSVSTSCKYRSRFEAMDTGMTSATDPESGRIVIFTFLNSILDHSPYISRGGL